MTQEPKVLELVAGSDGTFRAQPLRPRPFLRPDGIPSRCDLSQMTPAELAITHAMEVVEHAGASTALTEAVNLLCAARGCVADHVEAAS